MRSAFGRPLRLLLLSTPVGPLGSGLGGGVELTLHNIAKALSARQHSIQIVAPAGSECADFAIAQIEGALQTTAQSEGRDAPIVMPANSVLANMWHYAREVQAQHDLLLNFAYDWLPFYLTPFFDRPIAHLVSMGSLTNAMDHIIAQTIAQFPDSIGVHSQAQADTFSFSSQSYVLGNGFDLSLYQFCPQPERYLAWVGRIAPEKGLEDAVAAAQIAGMPLQIWGMMQDGTYWQQIQQDYPTAPIRYEGFLSTNQLQQELGKCQALLMTPHWVEAFGNVAIEALACGVPIIAYRRGGPAEIVQDGKTGWLVEPDSVTGLVDAIAHLNQIDRYACRAQAEAEYSLTALSNRLEQWFSAILAKSGTTNYLP